MLYVTRSKYFSVPAALVCASLALTAYGAIHRARSTESLPAVRAGPRTDTEGLLEAARCGGMQPVPVKTVEQQTLQALHRVRTQWQAARTARINLRSKNLIDA